MHLESLTNGALLQLNAPRKKLEDDDQESIVAP